jgi:hypothetical protein
VPRRISHAGNIPSVTAVTQAVWDAETGQVAVTADQDAARAEKVTAVLIKRCRTMLTERCRISPNNEVANSIMRLSTDQTAAFATYEPRMQRSSSP